MVYQFNANQKEWNKTNSLQAVKQALTMHPNGHVTSEKPRKIAAWNHGKTA